MSGVERAGFATVLFNPPGFECFAGTVNIDSPDGIETILSVNGSVGQASPIVFVGEGESIVGRLELPPAGGNGKFVVHANAGRPNDGTLFVVPGNIGTTCFPLLLNQGAAPIAVWNNIGKVNKVGASEYFDGNPIPDPPRAPADFLDLPIGDTTNLTAGTVITLQGVIVDPASASPKAASTTNAIILEIF